MAYTTATTIPTMASATTVSVVVVPLLSFNMARSFPGHGPFGPARAKRASNFVPTAAIRSPEDAHRRQVVQHIEADREQHQQHGRQKQRDDHRQLESLRHGLDRLVGVG